MTVFSCWIWDFARVKLPGWARFKEKLTTEQERHKAAFERYYGFGFRRSYRKLADQLGVSLSTVKLWARSFGWQSRISQRDAQAARKAADNALQSDSTDIRRNQKIVEMALVRLAKAIADGNVKMQLSDLDRLLNLRAFLEDQLDKQDPERPKTKEEFLYHRTLFLK